VLIALLVLLEASDARSVLYGKWDGESICTNVRPACHDEHAVYHIASSDKPDVVAMTMNKVVDGKEETMGTLEYHVDPAATTLTSEFRGFVWTFDRTGGRMQGTLKQLPNGEVIRNIRIEKR
jgi:hypothetical protein